MTTSSPTLELAAVVRLVDEFALDEGGGSGRFMARLARDNGWSWETAVAVTREYRRFLVIALVGGHGVSPSDAVDQAWHLHILDTRGYACFCRDVAGRFLHHTPSRGAVDAPTLRLKYRATLTSYRRFFAAEPPRAFWPSPETRGTETHRRVSTTKYWLVPKPSPSRWSR